MSFESRIDEHATFFSAQGMWWDSARRKKGVEMYIDEGAKKCAIESMQVFLKEGESFALTTTAVPFDMVRDVSQWNDKVVDWFNRKYPTPSLTKELGRFVAVGDRLWLLIEWLKKSLEAIKDGDVSHFRRFTIDERGHFL